MRTAPRAVVPGGRGKLHREGSRLKMLPDALNGAGAFAACQFQGDFRHLARYLRDVFFAVIEVDEQAVSDGFRTHGIARRRVLSVEPAGEGLDQVSVSLPVLHGLPERAAQRKGDGGYASRPRFQKEIRGAW